MKVFTVQYDGEENSAVTSSNKSAFQEMKSLFECNAEYSNSQGTVTIECWEVDEDMKDSRTYTEKDFIEMLENKFFD
jgi:hypothetical protein